MASTRASWASSNQHTTNVPTTSVPGRARTGAAATYPRALTWAECPTCRPSTLVRVIGRPVPRSPPSLARSTVGEALEPTATTGVRPCRSGASSTNPAGPRTPGRAGSAQG
ncbi:hypothetical protein [Ornithinimicrobium kibberense]|uniref:hypothetical protein n=1 Tax=Ornithinimicrobium kibberense TaxID=282060 RepID=UPI003609B595